MGRNAATCEHDENNARATLEKEWSQFTPSDQARCVRLVTLGGGPSYAELLTCLEMAKQVRELPGVTNWTAANPLRNHVTQNEIE